MVRGHPLRARARGIRQPKRGESAGAPDATGELTAFAKPSKGAFDRAYVIGESACAREVLGHSGEGSMSIDEPVDVVFPREAMLSGIVSGRGNVLVRTVRA